MISLLPHPEDEPQLSVDNFWPCILGKSGIAWIFELINELLTAFVLQNTIHKWNNIHSEIIDTSTYEAFKKCSLDVE